MVSAKFSTGLLVIFLGFKVSAQSAITQPRTLFFLDNIEIDYSRVTTMDPFRLDSIVFIKAIDAVKQFGARGRFGVVKIKSRETPIKFKNGHFQLTLYYSNDTTQNVKMQQYIGGNLKTLFDSMIVQHQGFYLLIDNLRNYDAESDHRFLQTVAGAFNLIHSGVAMDSVTTSMAEVLFYGFKIYRSGRFYFSGDGFRNVVSCAATDVNCVQTSINKCAPGTVITMEGCQTNVEGKEVIINKIIKMN